MSERNEFVKPDKVIGKEFDHLYKVKVSVDDGSFYITYTIYAHSKDAAETRGRQRAAHDYPHQRNHVVSSVRIPRREMDRQAVKTLGPCFNTDKESRRTIARGIRRAKGEKNV